VSSNSSAEDHSVGGSDLDFLPAERPLTAPKEKIEI
jgi:hypothetical protein